MGRNVLMVFLLCFMMAVPVCAGEQDAGTKTMIQWTINGLMDKVSRTAETLDAAKTLSVLTDDPGAVFFFNGQTYNKAGLVKALGEIYAKLASMKISMNTPTVTVSGPETATWTATGRADSVSKTGEKTTEYLTETWVWQKQAGVWRVVHYNESANTSAMRK